MFKKQTLGNGQIKIMAFQRRRTEKDHTNLGGTEKGYNWGDTERGYTHFISRESFDKGKGKSYTILVAVTLAVSKH